MSSPKLSTADLKQLKAFIIEKAPTCLHNPQGMLPYRFVTPSYDVIPGGDDQSDVAERSLVGHYLQMYDWDACFFSQAESLFGATGLATDFVSNFLSLKQSDGYVPRTISPNRIWDGHDLCKPFLSQSLLKEANSGKQKKPVSAELIRDIECYLRYFQRNRRNESGLYHWRNVLESGVDDSLSLLAPSEASKDENEDSAIYPDGRLLATDINSYLVAEYDAFSQLALQVGRKDLAEEFTGHARKLSSLIEETLWNEALGIYCNLDPVTSRPVLIRSWTGLAPIICGFAKPERAQETIERCVLSPQHFLRPYGLTSAAASEPLYNQAKRGLYGRAIVCNWQGPVWVLPNALTVRSLVALGYKQQAVDISQRVLTAMSNGLKETGKLYENYDAETGRPLWAPQFMSWNVLALELIQLLE